MTTWLRLLALLALVAAAHDLGAQGRQTPAGEWHYIGGDASHTRYSPLDQIDASNFGKLEVAWTWRGDNFGPTVDTIFRSTPLYVDGLLYTVAGPRRAVAAIDPATGETVWTYREPHTTRWNRGMRNNYGKGVAYGEVNGRKVIFYTSPAFFLHALDAKSGEHMEKWGRPVAIPGFPRSGVVDMLPDLVKDWEPWLTSGYKYDANHGIPRDLGNLSTSSPPIVVNGVVVVGNVHEQGYYQTRIENIPGDILAYDAGSGRPLWKFHVIPRPGEFGHDTWKNDAWRRTGDVSSWAPMSADPVRGLVYVPTNPPTIDFFGGFRPGDNLFGTSLLALDVKTGKRAWHFQTVHHDIWNFDNPTAPVLMDVPIGGRQTPIVVQTTKQGFAYTFNRETGKPIWPIEERPVAASDLPGESLSPTQPFPTRPKPLEIQELTEDNLIDFTPELRRQAIEIIRNYKTGPLFNPPIQVGHPSGKRSFVSCPSGSTNIYGPTVADPENGILFVTTERSCRAENMVPGSQMDEPEDPKTTGKTLSQWVVANRGDLRGPEGLPIWKPPYSRIIAIDMKTGDFLWEIPNGDTPERIRNHPALKGLTIPSTGEQSHAVMLPTKTLLISSPGSTPVLYATDKKTGHRLGTVKLPAPSQYGLMGYMHQGRQYVVAQVGSATHPGSLVALRLPAAITAGVSAQAPRVGISFTPQSNEFRDAAQQYQSIWAADGARMLDALERVSRLKFPENQVKAVVFEGVSHSGSRDIPMMMRASYTADTKKATLIHELGHRHIAQLERRPKDIDEHRVLFLVLYDTWVALYGEAFADAQVGIEKKRRGVYDYESAWNWALTLSKQERAARFAEIARQNASRSGG